MLESTGAARMPSNDAVLKDLGLIWPWFVALVLRMALNALASCFAIAEVSRRMSPTRPGTQVDQAG